MKRAIDSVLAVALLATLLPSGPPAAARTLPPGYFPAALEAPSTAQGWQELGERFPLRVHRSRIDAASDAPAVPALTLQIDPRIAYVRPHGLEAGLEEIARALASPAAIIDLRYSRSGEQDALELGGVLAETEFEIVLAGSGSPVSLTVAPAELGHGRGLRIVLVNRETAGPFEAVLAALQERKEVLLVGEKTRGDTGRFRADPDAPEWSVVDGDFRPAADESLLGLGVVPNLSVAVIPSDDAAAFAALEQGISVSALLDPAVDKMRFDEAQLLRQHGQTSEGRRPRPVPIAPVGPERQTPTGTSGDAAGRAEPEPPIDRVLHRAVNTVVALRALRLLPDT